MAAVVAQRDAGDIRYGSVGQGYPGFCIPYAESAISGRGGNFLTVFTEGYTINSLC